jgi:hypothetical protein
MMHKAVEIKVKYGKDGKPTEREWSIGPVFIWGLVAIILGLAGKAVVSIPAIERLLK